MAVLALAGCSSSSAAPPPGSPGITGLGHAQPGDCLTWDQAAGARQPAQVVSCDQPHLAEVADVTTVDGLGSAWPGPTQFATYADQVCPDEVTSYLGHPLDPQGQFATSALYPTAADWRVGARSLVCDLVRRSTDSAGGLTAFTGQVGSASAQPLFPVGTCLAQVNTDAAAVPCRAPHQVEVAGDATVPSGAGLPANYAGWQPLVGAACASEAQGYLAGPANFGAASGWLPIPPASWAAGRRLVTCLVGRQLDDGNWEVTTGSLRGSGL